MCPQARTRSPRLGSTALGIVSVSSLLLLVAVSTRLSPADATYACGINPCGSECDFACNTFVYRACCYNNNKKKKRFSPGATMVSSLATPLVDYHRSKVNQNRLEPSPTEPPADESYEEALRNVNALVKMIFGEKSPQANAISSPWNLSRQKVIEIGGLLKDGPRSVFSSDLALGIPMPTADN